MTILVYPFTDEIGVEKYWAVFKGWNTRGKAHKYFNAKQASDQAVGICLTTSADASTIVILGHCAPGSPNLRSETSYLAVVKGNPIAQAKQKNEKANETIGVDALATWLTKCGLNDNITTKIKCLNCSSGSADLNELTERTEASFATRLKNELRKPNIRLGNIRVFGYVGELMLIPDVMLNQPNKDKTKLVNIENRVLAVFNGYEKAFRGSEMRFEATGGVTDIASELSLLVRVRSQPGTIPM